jgi:2-oxoglutarate dehydrogenase complex dehydrogenase (E1) component-like enzyme
LKKRRKGVEQFEGMAHRGRLNVFNIFGKSTQDILVNLTVKIMTKNILTEM